MLNNYTLVFDRISPPIGKRQGYVFCRSRHSKIRWEKFELREMFDKYNFTSNSNKEKLRGVESNVLTETFGEFNFHCVLILAYIHVKVIYYICEQTEHQYISRYSNWDHPALLNQLQKRFNECK